MRKAMGTVCDLIDAAGRNGLPGEVNLAGKIRRRFDKV
jgi:hypothetical protein